MNKLLKRAFKSLTVRTYSIYAPFLPNRYKLYNFEGGKIYLNIKESVMMLSRALNIYESDKAKIITNKLRPQQTFIDIGANKGDFSLIAAKIVGESGKVFAFEPEPTNHHWIEKSINANNYNNISLLQLAIGNNNNTATLYIGKKSGWHTLKSSQPDREEGTIEVEVRKLDDILKEQNCENVNMIKIDVEGAELDVVRGAYNTLKNNKDIILLLDLHPQLGVNPKEVYTELSDLGFKVYPLKDISAQPISLNNCEHFDEIIAIRDKNLLNNNI